jgi:hypothetical protein
VREVTSVRIIDRTKAGVMALLIALSLVASALPASAGYKNDGFDFIDANNITWEKVKKPLPGNITWEDALRNVTWE